MMCLQHRADRCRTDTIACGPEYAEADRLRDVLVADGYRIEDTADGSRVRRQALRERVRLYYELA